jgi:Zn-dependent M28 family amino/carboxypeptidase
MVGNPANCYNPGLKFRCFFLGCFSAAVLLAESTPPKSAQPFLPAKTRALLGRITPGDLKGDLSFLASDALAGRFTPSPGLDAAAEFIASRFRAAGLEPGGDDGYFQTAHMLDRKMPRMTSGLEVKIGSASISVPADSIVVSSASNSAKFANAPTVIFNSYDPETLRKADVKGKVVLRPALDLSSISQEQRKEQYRNSHAFSDQAQQAGAVLELQVSDKASRRSQASLLVPEDAKSGTPVLRVNSAELLTAMSRTREAKVSVNIPAAENTKVIGRNVVGILRGSDPKLKDTYVLLTAHYDHIGTVDTATGLTMPVKNPGPDKIYNGANDDGSGTVSIIAIAQAFAKLTPRPKRSLVFMTFFGEERGEIGSEYFADHPLWPIANIVADLNLEQVGRTDASDGKQVNTASLTGYDYSDVTRYVEKAGALTGVKVYKNPEASDVYFTQSDNSPLADKGIPAHSLGVAFEFPDYHGLGDEWQKIDYDNMSRVDRMVALALLNMANDPKAPSWNGQNPNTAPFRDAQKNRKPEVK